MVLADLAEIDDEMLTAQQCLREDVRRSLQFLLKEQEEGRSRGRGGDRDTGRVGWGVCVSRGMTMKGEGGGAEQRSVRYDREKENKGRKENEFDRDSITEDEREIGKEREKEKDKEREKERDKEGERGREEIKNISSDLEKDLGPQILGSSAHTDNVDHDPELLARYPML